MHHARLLALIAATTAGTVSAQPFQEGLFPDSAPTRDSSELLQEEADTIRPMIQTQSARALLDATSMLPDPYRRWVWVSQSRQRAFSQVEYENLNDAERRGLRLSSIPEQTYYEGLGAGWGLMFARPADLAMLGSKLENPEALEGARVLILGLDTVLAPRLFASLGAHAEATLETDLAQFIYRGPMDTGEVDRDSGRPGSITLARGVWPKDTLEGAEQGMMFNGESVEFSGEYDLIIAMNMMRKSEISPPAPRVVGQPQSEGFDIGVAPEELPATIAAALRPGGRAILYNVVPAQTPRPNNFTQLNDERAPFSQADIDRAGLVAIALDADDRVGFRGYAQLTGFTPAQTGIQGFTDLEESRVAYTILAKPGAD